MHCSQPRARAGLLVHVQLTTTYGSPSLIVHGCTPPTRVCLSGRPAGARDACRRSPCAPPCPAVPPGGSLGGEGGKGCLSPLRSFNVLEPLGLCPPPPLGDAWGGARAPPGVARTRALPGALVASRVLVREIASGGVCALLAGPARPWTPPRSRPPPAAQAATTPAALVPQCALAVSAGIGGGGGCSSDWTLCPSGG